MKKTILARAARRTQPPHRRARLRALGTAVGERLERLRLRLAGPRGTLALAALGLATGIAAGAVMLAFRFAIELLHAWLLPYGEPDAFETLASAPRLVFPIGGALAVIAVIATLGGGALRTGVVHVLERLAYFEGGLPLKNALLQFFGGVFALAGGLSVGREGPGIHLGAATASLLGQWWRLPNNSIRTLVACGTAAAIACSFNTPLAGVVFAMEVVVMEYTVVGFAPVILAAVSGAALARMAYGATPAFMVPQLTLGSLWELPWIAVMGVAIGALAAGFVRLLGLLMRRLQPWPWWMRIAAAGLLVGGCGIPVPEVLGLGYDTVSRVLVGDLGIKLLLAIAALKLFATAFSIGAGVPGGLIGPSLVIGAAFGAVLGLLGAAWAPVAVSGLGLYAMLGMGAMMGATLQAPLAALIALLELTGNPNVILPGMLAIVAAHLTARELFGVEPVFLMQMRVLGLDYANDPIAQSLRRIGVAAVMSRSFKIAPSIIDAEAAAALLEDVPQWIVVERNGDRVLLPAADLARHLGARRDGEVNLLEIPANRRQLAPIHPQATLQEALAVLDREQVDALYVERPIAPLATRIFGVLTRAEVEAAYRPRASASKRPRD